MSWSPRGTRGVSESENAPEARRQRRQRPRLSRLSPPLPLLPGWRDVTAGEDRKTSATLLFGAGASVFDEKHLRNDATALLMGVRMATATVAHMGFVDATFYKTIDSNLTRAIAHYSQFSEEDVHHDFTKAEMQAQEDAIPFKNSYSPSNPRPYAMPLRLEVPRRSISMETGAGRHYTFPDLGPPQAAAPVADEHLFAMQQLGMVGELKDFFWQLMRLGYEGMDARLILKIGISLFTFFVAPSGPVVFAAAMVPRIADGVLGNGLFAGGSAFWVGIALRQAARDRLTAAPIEYIENIVEGGMRIGEGLVALVRNGQRVQESVFDAASGFLDPSVISRRIQAADERNLGDGPGGQLARAMGRFADFLLDHPGIVIGGASAATLLSLVYEFRNVYSPARCRAYLANFADDAALASGLGNFRDRQEERIRLLRLFQRTGAANPDVQMDLNAAEARLNGLCREWEAIFDGLDDADDACARANRFEALIPQLQAAARRLVVEFFTDDEWVRRVQLMERNLESLFALPRAFAEAELVRRYYGDKDRNVGPWRQKLHVDYALAGEDYGPTRDCVEGTYRPLGAYAFYNHADVATHTRVVQILEHLLGHRRAILQYGLPSPVERLENAANIFDNHVANVDPFPNIPRAFGAYERLGPGNRPGHRYRPGDLCGGVRYDAMAQPPPSGEGYRWICGPIERDEDGTHMWREEEIPEDAGRVPPVVFDPLAAGAGVGASIVDQALARMRLRP